MISPKLKIIRPKFNGNRRTVKELLRVARDDNDLVEAIVLGYDKEGREILLGGAMDKRDLLWLLEWARKAIGPKTS